ncbi:MAG TPA: SRPBCC domain-containing protein [Chryseolinea sp.]
MKQDIVVTRIYNAPVETVWRAWVEPELVKRWWGPDRFTCPSAKIDFREGGASVVCMRAPKEFGGQDTYSVWVYTKITPFERIEFIQNLSNEQGMKMNPAELGMPPDFQEDVRTVVTFKRLGANKTEMTVTEYDWEVGGQMSVFAKMGLEQCMDKMGEIFVEA